jgi:hypothetical protein
MWGRKSAERALTTIAQQILGKRGSVFRSLKANWLVPLMICDGHEYSDHTHHACAPWPTLMATNS